MLGDEGSGAVLGRNLVNGIFKEHIPLRGEFLEACGMTYEEIIRRVYNEPFANRFLASFAPFILDHIGCPEVRRMVLRSFGDFAERNLSRYPKGLPVSFVGGIGKIRGVIIGVVLLRIIFVGLTFMSVSSNLQYIIKGLIILVACAIDMRKYLVRK